MLIVVDPKLFKYKCGHKCGPIRDILQIGESEGVLLKCSQMLNKNEHFVII